MTPTNTMGRPGKDGPQTQVTQGQYTTAAGHRKPLRSFDEAIRLAACRPQPLSADLAGPSLPLRLASLSWALTFGLGVI